MSNNTFGKTLPKIHREDVEIRKLWTTDGGKYVANNNQSFLDRFVEVLTSEYLKVTTTMATINYKFFVQFHAIDE